MKTMGPIVLNGKYDCMDTLGHTKQLCVARLKLGEFEWLVEYLSEIDWCLLFENLYILGNKAYGNRVLEETVGSMTLM